MVKPFRRKMNVKPNSKIFCQFSVEVSRSMKNIKPDIETALVIISIWGAWLHLIHLNTFK